jgi:hypothetical protein
MSIQAWQPVVATLLVPLLSVLLRPEWPAQLKALVTASVCVLVAVAAATFQGQTSPADLFTAAVVVLTIARAVYAAVARPLGLADALEWGINVLPAPGAAAPPASPDPPASS